MIENTTRAEQFDADTPIEAIVEFVDAVRECPSGSGEDLVPLLSEAHPLYADRPANQAVKLRAYTMAALERTGLPESALPYLRESLESSLHPYTVAAAARALRGTAHSNKAVSDRLLNAIFNIWQSDRPVCFSGYNVKWPQPEISSGLTEIFQTLAHFGSDARHYLPVLEQLAGDPSKFSDAAYTCLLHSIDEIRSHLEDTPNQLGRVSAPPSQSDKHSRSQKKAWPPRYLRLEDQAAEQINWDDFFGQKPTVVGFFYTRCGNPYKCTRTIQNLARIQDEVEYKGLTGQVRICAISYDAQFDTPAALRSYGDARNFRFDEDNRMFRVSEGFEKLVEQMELEVSFVGTQVSSHRIELFLLSGSGEVVDSFLRLQSEPETVADALFKLHQASSVRLSRG